MVCVNELTQLTHSDIRPKAQYSTIQALYAALDRYRDVVFITDDVFRIQVTRRDSNTPRYINSLQYVNWSTERHLGFRQDEIRGKSLKDYLTEGNVRVTTMNLCLRWGREWQGDVTLKRKGQEPASALCQAVPVSCVGR